MNVKEKGNRGERELAKYLTAHGYTSRRGLQYQSGQVEADVVGLPGHHIECKRCQQLEIPKWMKQSRRDAKPGEVPIVVYRQNYRPWNVAIQAGHLVGIITGFPEDRTELVTLSLDDFMEILGGKHGKHHLEEETGAGDP